MKKKIFLTVFVSVLVLSAISVIPLSTASTTQAFTTRILWGATVEGNVMALQTVPDINGDGHEDVLVVSKVPGGGYLTLVNGKNGLTIHESSLDYEPTEVLYVQESDRIAVARIGGTDVYDTQLNLNYSIPVCQSWGHMYHYLFYYTGCWIMNQSDYGINPPEMYFEWNYTTAYGEWTLGSYQYGYVSEVPAWFMNYTASLPPPSTWNPWPYMLNVSLGLPARYEYAPKHLQTFDGTDLALCAGYYYPTDNNTDFLSYSIINGSLNWRTAGLNVPLLEISEVILPPDFPPLDLPPDTCIFAPIFGLHDLKVLSPTRGVGLMNTIGLAGINVSNPSHLGEWPLILLDNNGGKVEQYTRVHKYGFDYGWYMTCVENATYESHFVSPITPYDENHFLLTVTEGGVRSVLVCYSIANDNFTIVWKTPVDLGDMNRGFPIVDVNSDDKKEVIAVSDGVVAVFDGSDGSKLYGTDIPTFCIQDVAILSDIDGDGINEVVIYTNEGYGYLVSFESTEQATYWKEFLGPAWETFISPVEDVDGDGFKDLVAAGGNTVKCYWMASTPTISISTDKASYVLGETVVVEIIAVNPTGTPYLSCRLVVNITWPAGNGMIINDTGTFTLPAESSETWTLSIPIPDSIFVADGVYTFTATLTYNDNTTTDTTSIEIARVSIMETVFDVLWNDETYPVTVESNSTITDFNFSQPDKQISFNVTGPSGTIGFCNVTIPNNLMWGEFTVLVNGEPPIELISSSNATHNSFYFTFEFQSTSKVQITATEVIPEFPTWTSMLLLLIVLAAAIIINKRRLLKT